MPPAEVASVIEDLLTPYHLLILFALLFFLFGAKRLPGLGKSLGHGIREFRGGLAGLAADHDDESPEAATDEPLTLAAAGEPLTLAAADESLTSAAADEPLTLAAADESSAPAAGDQSPRPV
jgi:sec-independent protein translocase protein TatA